MEGGRDGRREGGKRERNSQELKIKLKQFRSQQSQDDM